MGHVARVAVCIGLCGYRMIARASPRAEARGVRAGGMARGVVLGGWQGSLGCCGAWGTCREHARGVLVSIPGRLWWLGGP